MPLLPHRLRWLSTRNGSFTPPLANNIPPERQSGRRCVSGDSETDCGVIKRVLAGSLEIFKTHSDSADETGTLLSSTRCPSRKRNGSAWVQKRPVMDDAAAVRFTTGVAVPYRCPPSCDRPQFVFWLRYRLKVDMPAPN